MRPVLSLPCHRLRLRHAEQVAQLREEQGIVGPFRRGGVLPAGDEIVNGRGGHGEPVGEFDVGHSIELWSEFTRAGKAYVMFPDPQGCEMQVV